MLINVGDKVLSSLEFEIAINSINIRGNCNLEIKKMGCWNLKHLESCYC